MNTRLKIICILFGLTYLFIIGETIYNELLPAFSSGFSKGLAEGESMHQKNNASIEGAEDFFFYVKPKAGRFSFPMALLNQKTGQSIQVETNMFLVEISKPFKLPVWLIVADICYLLLAFGLLFLSIYIPILVYKVIRSIVKNGIFDPVNIKRIRRIAYSIFIIFGIAAYSSLIHSIKAKTLISLEDYKIIFSIRDDYSFLLMGFITLLFAEILKISHRMKEEVDLTV
jgi:hypothetical protein